ncbi:MAG: PPC domain-containing protein, partial [Kiritimatiellae bacterium]|nr:PPC domain-containing protein [Kiritimatiellia bacterium]
MLRLIVMAMALGPLAVFGQSPDAYEPDDTNTQASVIAPGSNQVHTIHVAGDVDWIKFTGQANHRYRIETSDPSGAISTFDTIIYLYSSDATTLLARNDDGNNYHFSTIEYVPTAIGTYYIKVKEFFGAGGPQPTGSYRITLTDLGVVSTASSGTVVEEVIDCDEEGWPVRASPYTTFTNQLGVLRWFGSITNAFGKNGVWAELTVASGQWRCVDGSDMSAWSALTEAPAVPESPSVAVKGPKVYIAWMHRADPTAIGRIYLKCWNGSSWIELAGSASGSGVGLPNQQFEKDASNPHLGLDINGNPVVAFQQPIITMSGQNVSYVQAICVRRFVGDVNTGSGQWWGMDGSTNGAVPGATLAFDPDLKMDANGYPVVAWGDPQQARIV